MILKGVLVFLTGNVTVANIYGISNYWTFDMISTAILTFF
jgi:hypothetical protein